MSATRCILAFLLAVGLLAPHSLAQPGALDPTFGDGGVVVSSDDALWQGVAVQPDGSVVIAGSSAEGDGTVWRLLPDGSLDPSFGSDGQSEPFEGSQFGERLVAVHVRSGGELVATGSTSGFCFGGCPPGPLVQYEPDGAFAFGTKTLSNALALDERADGRVVVFGSWVSDDGTGGCSIAEHTAEGAAVAGYGYGSSELDALGLVYSRCAGGSLLDNGSTVVYLGLSDPGVGAPRGGVARFGEDGALDASYGEGGVALTPPGIHEVRSGASGPGGSVLLGGLLAVRGGTVAVARLTPDGAPDAGFGDGGITSFPELGGAEIRAMAPQPDGKLLIVGTVMLTLSPFVARVLPDGSLDPAFGDDGVASLPGTGYVADLALDAEGRVVIVGSYFERESSPGFIVRLLNDGAVATEPSVLPKHLTLSAPAPNPAATQTTLAYTLAERTDPVRLAVYDVLGREVAVLAKGTLPAGRHEATLDASRLAPGLYVARLSSGGEVATRRLTVVR